MLLPLPIKSLYLLSINYHMKKGLKVTLIILAVIFVLLLLASLLVSPIAKWYIEKHDKELIGREVTMEKLNVRLLPGSLSVENLVLYEANEVDTFVSVERFEADMQVWGILRKSIIVDSIAVVAPDATVLRRNNGLNFDDILAFFASKPQEETADTTSSDWAIILRNIGLHQGQVRYADDILDIDWTMHHIELNIPEIDLSGSGTKAQLYLDFARGGSLALAADYNRSTLDYELECRITDYPLGVLMPFMKDVVNVGDVKGKLALDLHACGDVKNIMASDLDGSIQIDSTTVYDINNRQLLALNCFRTDIEHINIAHDYNIKLRELFIDGLSAQYEIYSNGGNNFETVFASQPDTIASEVIAESEVEIVENTADTTSRVPQLNLAITNLQLNNGNFVFTDNTLPEPFSMRLSKMHFKSPNFTTHGHNNIELFSVIQETGAMRIKWEGDIALREHDLSIYLNNFDLENISPYSLDFLGYPITDGKMSFKGQNIISNGMLKGANDLSLYNPTVDKKRSDIDAEYGAVPLKLAIVVLTDREGKAELNLPVSGDLNSPHFSYGKIILQAIVNLIVKIAAAPIDLIANSLGIDSGKINEIKFDAWQRQFSPEQYDKIETLSTIVKEKPELAIELIHEVNYKEGIQAIVEDDMRCAYYLSQNPDRAELLNMVDIDTYRKIPLKGDAITKFANRQLADRGLSTDGSLNDKMHRLYGEKALDKLLQNVEMRDRSTMMHWQQMLGMPDGSLQIKSPTRDEIKQHSGKTRYKVGIVIREENVTTDADEEAVVPNETDTIQLSVDE